MGDVHGHYDQMIEVLDRAKFDPELDQLIQIGDLVDRGPKSKDVIQWFIDMTKKYGDHIISVRGNHDEWFRRWLDPNTDAIDHMDLAEVWKPQGGNETLRSYEENDHLTKHKHFEFLCAQKDFYSNLEHNFCFVHAAYHQKYVKMSGYMAGHRSSMYWDREFWNYAIFCDMMDVPIHKVMKYPYEDYDKFFIGHTPIAGPRTEMVDFKPQKRLNVWNLDTGAAYGGVITVMDAVSEQFWISSKTPGWS